MKRGGMQGCQETAMSFFIANVWCRAINSNLLLKMQNYCIFIRMIISKYITIYYRGTITKGEKTYHRTDRQKRTWQDVRWFGDMVKAQASHRWLSRNPLFLCHVMERIFPASVNPEMKPSVKGFYFQSSDCGSGNLILTSQLWVSWGCTWLSEYREWGANVFDTLSFGRSHCHPMPMDPFLDPSKTSFSEREGICVFLWLIHAAWQKLAQRWKAIILWLKNTRRDKNKFPCLLVSSPTMAGLLLLSLTCTLLLCSWRLLLPARLGLHSSG